MREYQAKVQWQDPTAETAIERVQHEALPVSISKHRQVEPLSKFNDPAAHKGRRRLLKALNNEIASLDRADPRRRQLLKDRSILERQQFTSRVFAYELI